MSTTTMEEEVERNQVEMENIEQEEKEKEPERRNFSLLQRE